MHPHDLDLVQALARPRAGVISRQQLVRAHFDHELPSREAAAGRWQRVLPGIYVVGSASPTFEQRCHASLLHAGRRAEITGAAGCQLHNIAQRDSGDLHVVVLVPHATRKVSHDFCELVRTRTVPPAVDLAAPGQARLLVAPMVRCVADAVRHAEDLADARALACRAARDQRLDWQGLAEAATRPGRGAGHLSRVVRDLEDGVRSAPEGELHDVLLRAARKGQVPPYLLNPEVYVDGQLIGSPDAWFPGLGLGDEMDSREWHEETGLLDATLLRHEAFTSHGLALNHTTPARFRASPAAHLAKLAALTQERRAMLRPEPAGLVVLARGPLLPERSFWPLVPAHRLGLGKVCRRAAA
jgi:hypothetical protein